MRLSVKKGIVILICMFALCGLIYMDSAGEVETAGTELSFSLGEELINAWQGEDQTYYLFLPSYAELEEVKLQSYATEFEIADEQAIVMRGGSLAGLPFDQKLECKSASTKEEFTLCIMRSENLPTLFIETDSGSVEAIWSDKDVEENGKIQVFDETGSQLYRSGLKSIKGRGNYSFSNYEKKPFSITTKEEVSLLGLGAGTQYSLLSNASDPTLIRNELARRMEEALETEYTNVGRFVDLYVNGDYLGNYYLCENIEVGTQRIQITNLEEQMDRLYQKSKYESFTDYVTEKTHAKVMEYNPADITGGYIVERDFKDRYLLEYGENPSSFITEGEEHFIVKSPLYCSDEQIEYLKECFDKAEAALLAEDGKHPTTGECYDQLIDVDSFVKKYLVEEVTKNYDAGVSSSFFYKDSDSVDGRIKAAPIWDCDMSLGNHLDWMEYFSEDPRGVSLLSLHQHASSWYEALYQKEEGYEKICDYYAKSVAPYLEELEKTLVDEYKEYLSASAAMNDIRWKVDFQNNEYYTDRDTSFEELKEFIGQRKAFLDEVWIEQIPYCIVTFEVDDAIQEIRYIKEGDTIGPLLDEKSAGVGIWVYADGREAVSEADQVTEDTVITGAGRTTTTP